jgi:hypothetical protein
MHLDYAKAVMEWTRKTLCGAGRDLANECMITIDTGKVVNRSSRPSPQRAG